jgi:hypothetical protein
LSTDVNRHRLRRLVEAVKRREVLVEGEIREVIRSRL